MFLCYCSFLHHPVDVSTSLQLCVLPCMNAAALSCLCCREIVLLHFVYIAITY